MQLTVNLSAIGNYTHMYLPHSHLSMLPWAPLIVSTVHAINLRANIYEDQIPHTSNSLSFQVLSSRSAIILAWFPLDTSSGSFLSWILLAQYFSLCWRVSLFSSRAVVTKIISHFTAQRINPQKLMTHDIPRIFFLQNYCLTSDLPSLYLIDTQNNSALWGMTDSILLSLPDHFA